jgi:hypothetical protein
MIETFSNISFGLGLAAGMVLAIVVQVGIRITMVVWQWDLKPLLARFKERFFPA